jgi:hypothetical protein
VYGGGVDQCILWLSFALNKDDKMKVCISSSSRFACLENFADFRVRRFLQICTAGFESFMSCDTWPVKFCKNKFWSNIICSNEFCSNEFCSKDFCSKEFCWKEFCSNEFCSNEFCSNEFCSM